MQLYHIDGFTSVTEDGDGNVLVTRPCIMGKIHTHSVGKTYSVLEVAVWLSLRIKRKPNRLVQEEFPKMSAEDREFLMTGITPAEWKEMFKREDDECA